MSRGWADSFLTWAALAVMAILVALHSDRITALEARIVTLEAAAELSRQRHEVCACTLKGAWSGVPPEWDSDYWQASP